MPPAEGRSGVVDLDPARRRCRVRTASDRRPAAPARLRRPRDRGHDRVPDQLVPPAGGARVAAARIVQRGRRARRLGEHLVRHVRAHRRHARPARPLERLLRPDPVLRHRVPGAAAEHAGAGAEAAAAVLRRPDARPLPERCRRRLAARGRTPSAPAPASRRALARARRDPEGTARRIRRCSSSATSTTTAATSTASARRRSPTAARASRCTSSASTRRRRTWRSSAGS